MHTRDEKIFHTAVLFAAAVACSSSASSPVNPGASGSPAAEAHRKAYVGLFGDKAVAVLDTLTNEVVKTIGVTAPDGLVLTPDGKKVYVASGDTGSVKVIATDTDSIVTSIDVGAKPAGLAITPDGRRLVVSVGGANEAVIIDTETDAVVKRAPVEQAHASCISDDGKYAYVGSQATTAPAVVVVDILGQAPPTSLKVDKSPRMLACEPGRVYFTAVGLDGVEVIDLATGMLNAPIPSGGSPHDVRATLDRKFELVVSQTAGDLEFIDPDSKAVVGNVPTGKLPHWITLTPDGAFAYVTNEGEDDIAIVDLVTRRVTNTFAIGDAPRKMALQR
jgi:YVTN family beta-propeller protein